MSTQYLNKDFNQLKSVLTDYIKNNYQNYSDFGPSSPGQMFTDLAAYVGDVLSFYTDTQVQETMLMEAKERKNILPIAYSLGYRPRATKASTVILDVYQIIPSDAANSFEPDYRYTTKIEENASIGSSSDTSVVFLTERMVDFSQSSSFDPTDVSVYSYYEGTNNPLYYVLKKQVPAYSGEIKTKSYSFSTAQQFQKIQLVDNDIIQILDATDSDGNKWYHVPYLAQDTIIDETFNTSENEPNHYQNSDQTPFMLRLKKVNKRFTSRFLDNTTLEISFGAGTSGKDSELILPNPYNVGLGLPNGISKLNTAFDPSNFFFTNEYGQAPTNTTITFSYVVGGGAKSNVPANTITQLNNVKSIINTNGLDADVVAIVKDSIRFDNEIGATGGGPGDTLEEIRQNTLSNFPSQLRGVTKADYLTRVLSMPSKYGYISKATVERDPNNPLGLSVYVLSNNIDNKLTLANSSTKKNLKTYLSQYKILTDAITIKDAFYINIGINFEISVLQGFNAQQVLVSAIQAIQDYFDIDKWSIGQPIILSQVENAISCAGVNGVAAVKKLEIINLYGGNYSPYKYDINGATLNKVIYPSLDPMIFEIRFPDQDINGRIVGL